MPKGDNPNPRARIGMRAVWDKDRFPQLNDPQPYPPTQPFPFTETSHVKQGWECPKCGHVYAPHVTECTHCNHDNDNQITKE